MLAHATPDRDWPGVSVRGSGVTAGFCLPLGSRTRFTPPMTFQLMHGDRGGLTKSGADKPSLDVGKQVRDHDTARSRRASASGALHRVGSSSPM